MPARIRLGTVTVVLIAVGAAPMLTFGFESGKVGRPQQVIHSMQAVAAEASTLLAASRNGEPLRLNVGPTGMTLELAPERPTPLAARLRSLSPADQIYLIMQRLHSAGPTLSGYDVYLSLPADVAPDTSDRHYVGNFNFFDAESGRRNAVFNITDLARALSRDGALDRPTVTIVPTGAQENDANPEIGKIVMIAVPA